MENLVQRARDSSLPLCPLLFAVAVLSAVAVTAASLPAWRAARTDPARALRGE